MLLRVSRLFSFSYEVLDHWHGCRYFTPSKDKNCCAGRRELFAELLRCGGMKPVIENTEETESCQAVLLNIIRRFWSRYFLSRRIQWRNMWNKNYGQLKLRNAAQETYLYIFHWTKNGSLLNSSWTVIFRDKEEITFMY